MRLPARPCCTRFGEPANQGKDAVVEEIVDRGDATKVRDFGEAVKHAGRASADGASSATS